MTLKLLTANSIGTMWIILTIVVPLELLQESGVVFSLLTLLNCIFILKSNGLSDQIIYNLYDQDEALIKEIEAIVI